MKSVKLGDQVRDGVTGFTGIATARVEYLNKCVQCEGTSQVRHDGQPIAGQWIDSEQLQVVLEEQALWEGVPSGGPVRAHGGRSHPSRA